MILEELEAATCVAIWVVLFISSYATAPGLLSYVLVQIHTLSFPSLIETLSSYDSVVFRRTGPRSGNEQPATDEEEMAG